jgi:PadR family transcriptional regulator PadR
MNHVIHTWASRTQAALSFVRGGHIVAEKDSWISQIRKGVIEVAILGLLDCEETYGSELVDKLAVYPALAISAGTVYPLMSRLKKAGLIDSVWRESPVGPPRKYYTLTDLGRSELGDMMIAWDSMSGAMSEVLQEVSG